MLTYIFNWPVVLTHVGSVLGDGDRYGKPKSRECKPKLIKKTPKNNKTKKTNKKNHSQTKLYAKFEFGSTADFFLPAPKGEKVSSPV